MPPPNTPTKAIKAGNDINSLIQTISGEWSLHLPVRDAQWSPSKNSNKSIENQIYAAVQYLYFKDEEALEYAVAEFKDHARKNWVPKPRAEPDVLPSRGLPASTRQETFLRTRDISDTKAAELREALLDVLKSVAEKVKAGVPYKIEANRKGGQ